MSAPSRLFAKSSRLLVPVLAALLLWSGSFATVRAEVLGDRHACHATSAAPAAPDAVPHSFACGGTPRGYQTGTLWLRYDLERIAGVDRSDLIVFVRNSRFDRIEAAFRYADGRTITHEVHGGAFGAHWRPGCGWRRPC